MKLAQLAEVARAELIGTGEIEIRSVTDLEGARADSIVMVADTRLLPDAEASPAGALLVGSGAAPAAKPALRAANLRAAFARVLGALAEDRPAKRGIHPTAVVAPDAEIGPDAALSALVVIEQGARIGARSRIMAGAFIGERATIGADCLVYPNVTVYPNTVIGDRVSIHSSTVIGSDGFGYATEDGVHIKIPHLGRVVIEDDVEIGACVTVDRATLGETRIGRGTKIDNLVQVAHNVTIGQGVFVVSLTGISGSVSIGPGAILAGQSGVADHVNVGAQARVLGRAGVTRDVPEGATVSGFPARDHREELRIMAAARRLPELLERIRALESRASDTTTRRPRRPPRP